MSNDGIIWNAAVKMYCRQKRKDIYLSFDTLLYHTYMDWMIKYFKKIVQNYFSLWLIVAIICLSIYQNGPHCQ